MKTLEFLSTLNTAPKGWGFWLDRQRTDENHIGQYSFENDRLPKSFVHVGSLNELAHLRQQYILSHFDGRHSEEELGIEWAREVLAKVT